ncbi:MAG: hypothetical protein HYZ37_09075 [Candidatus Solibacter usitatus]|nr:hypothetical protein [Candidatus Solibacter usitatus]
MADQQTPGEKDLLRRHVETWRKAGPELEAIRKREIETADTKLAVQQLFPNSMEFWHGIPVQTTSGLVQQQALFAKLA